MKSLTGPRHARYRRAGKITDPDLLHTLGDGLAEILNVVSREEWRDFTAVEKCALGVFHRHLGEDMGIPFDALPSASEGWTDGLHFAMELTDWTVRYEEEVARPTATNDQYVRVYVDSGLSSLPGGLRMAVRKMLGYGLDDVMRASLWYVPRGIARFLSTYSFSLETPGPIFSFVLGFIQGVRKLFLRYLALPRPSFRAVKPVHDTPNPETNLYNFERKGLQPWYMKPGFGSKWGPGALLVKAFGGRVPGSHGDRYIPQGYDLMTIGPEPQKGKGIDEMAMDVEVIKAKGVATCPFSQAKSGFN